MQEPGSNWDWSMMSNRNFWSDLAASQSNKDLSFFSNGTSSPSTPKDETTMNSSFTSYNQWSSSYFPRYHLWGSPPPTPGVDTNGSRPQTQLSNLTAGSSRSTSPDWNTKYGSWNDSAAGWRNDTRHSDGSDVMCTYDSATTNKWMQGPIGAGSPSIGQCSSIWNSAQRQTNPAYDSRADQHAISYDQRPGTIDSSLALEKLAEQFQEFKLKPQILTKRISDRKIKANMRKPACIECVFCKNNEESEKVYKSHVLKDVYGRIQCPVLRMYRCPICGNPGGDEAHTIRYCPKSKSRIGKLENLNSWKKVEKRKFA